MHGGTDESKRIRRIKKGTLFLTLHMAWTGFPEGGDVNEEERTEGKWRDEKERTSLPLCYTTRVDEQNARERTDHTVTRENDLTGKNVVVR